MNSAEGNPLGTSGGPHGGNSPGSPHLPTQPHPNVHVTGRATPTGDIRDSVEELLFRSTRQQSFEGTAPMARPRLSDQLVLKVASQLTDRDRYLCDLLYEHKVLTTNQLCDAAFNSLITARHRLARLHDLRVLDRFQPLRPIGSSPHHWVLDELGAAIVAANRGVEPRELAWRRGRALALATSQRLDHLVGANGCFTGLLRTGRHQPNARLVRWCSERRCLAEWDGLVRPDGYGIWVEDGARVGFFLEYDRGTEPLDRLAAKLGGYQELTEVEPDPVLVLFALPGHRREAGVRRALSTQAAPDTVVATGVLPSGRTIADAIWLPLGVSDSRRRLRELATTR